MLLDATASAGGCLGAGLLAGFALGFLGGLWLATRRGRG